MSHLFDLTHIASHLVVIFWLRFTKLEVDDDDFVLSDEHSVRSVLLHLSLGIDVEEITLVHHLPFVREPITYQVAVESFSQHVFDSLFRDVLIVEHTV